MAKNPLLLITLILLSIWLTFVMNGIVSMRQQETSNRLHAMILGCKYLGPLSQPSDILVFDCKNKMELHRSIPWQK